MTKFRKELFILIFYSITSKKVSSSLHEVCRMNFLIVLKINNLIIKLILNLQKNIFFILKSSKPNELKISFISTFESLRTQISRKICNNNQRSIFFIFNFSKFNFIPHSQVKILIKFPERIELFSKIIFHKILL